MGKKRIAQKGQREGGSGQQGRVKAPNKKLNQGVLHIQATYNNTKVLLYDTKGNLVCRSSSGALGFKGSRKGTPYAAAKAGEMVGEMAKQMGVKDVNVVIKGVGSGRESAVRGVIGKGISLLSIEDKTPVPFNGPRPPKPRRV